MQSDGNDWIRFEREDLLQGHAISKIRFVPDGMTYMWMANANAFSQSNWRIQNEFKTGNTSTSKRFMPYTKYEQNQPRTAVFKQVAWSRLKLRMNRILWKNKVFFNFMQYSIVALFLLYHRGDLIILFTGMDYKMTT